MREEYKGYTISIEVDYYAEDPREIFDFWTQDAVDAWHNGEVYGNIIEDHNGEVIDACWGFYGELDFCLATAREQVDSYTQQRDNKHALALVAGF